MISSTARMQKLTAICRCRHHASILLALLTWPPHRTDRGQRGHVGQRRRMSASPSAWTHPAEPSTHYMYARRCGLRCRLCLRLALGEEECSPDMPRARRPLTRVIWVHCTTITRQRLSLARPSASSHAGEGELEAGHGIRRGPAMMRCTHGKHAAPAESICPQTRGPFWPNKNESGLRGHSLCYTAVKSFR